MRGVLRGLGPLEMPTLDKIAGLDWEDINHCLSIPPLAAPCIQTLRVLHCKDDVPNEFGREDYSMGPFHSGEVGAELDYTMTARVKESGLPKLACLEVGKCMAGFINSDGEGWRSFTSSLEVVNCECECGE
jgi:hypothetical protein